MVNLHDNTDTGNAANMPRMDDRRHNPSPRPGETIAYVRRVRGRSCDLLELVSCPYGCAKAHLHGGGPLNSPTGTATGGRISHCTTGPGVDEQYFLIEVEVKALGDAAA